MGGRDLLNKTISHNDCSLTTISVSVVSRCSVSGRDVAIAISHTAWPDFNDALASIMHRDVGERDETQVSGGGSARSLRIRVPVSVWKIHVVPHRSSSVLLPFRLFLLASRMQYPPNGVWNYPLRRACPSVTFNIGENRGIFAGRMHNSRRLQFREWIESSIKYLRS